jgi:hypothetical protein
MACAPNLPAVPDSFPVFRTGRYVGKSTGHHTDAPMAASVVDAPRRTICLALSRPSTAALMIPPAKPAPFPNRVQAEAGGRLARAHVPLDSQG